jgi:cyclase
MGAPDEISKKFVHGGVDELYIDDVVASLYGRKINLNIIKKITETLSIPKIFGGNISSHEEAIKILALGADKVALNSNLFHRPQLVEEIALKTGSQAVIGVIHAKQIGKKDYTAHYESGREPSNKCVFEWAKILETSGCGEIAVISVDRDGANIGPDFILAEKLRETVKCQLAFGGGISSKEEARKLQLDIDIDCLILSRALHFKELTANDLRS